MLSVLGGLSLGILWYIRGHRVYKMLRNQKPLRRGIQDCKRGQRTVKKKEEGSLCTSWLLFVTKTCPH
uniref:Uncharacterized protein n=1 Tax=Ixodes ricinus TaxID=34613 RepID=A0A6B0U0L1_IXORI